jgi:hypothetical protein
VGQDHVEAARWYLKAAEQGHAEAQHNLGTMYQSGLGVGQDHAKAVQWYQRAAEQGYAAAQHNLGVMYLAGQGVAQDTLRAHMWFDLASRRGLEAARKGRDAAASELTPDQIAEAQRLVREWKPVAER